jgi:hypothetical protein
MRKISYSIDNQWLLRLLILTALLISLPLTIYARVVTPKLDESVKAKISKSYLSLPLRFETNQGQTDSQIRFLARGSNYTLFLTPAEVVVTLMKSDPENSAEKYTSLTKTKIIAEKATSTTVRIKLDGSNPETKVMGLEEQRSKSHYFHGNDQKKWLTSVTNYAKVKYEAIYPGIDLIFYGNDRQLEYDFLR